MAKKKRPPEEAEHLDESWLVPYADVLTLLLALFIVLFATSKVDQEKFSQMAQSFSVIFSGGGIMSGGGSGIMPSTNSADTGKSTGGGNGAAIEAEQLDDVKRRLDDYIMENNLQNQLNTRLTDEGLVIEIKDRVLFNSGDARLLEQGRDVSKTIADILNDTNQNVLISGHTDNMPINTPEFPSNWELSSKRAINFMKDMLYENSNLNPQRFSAVGYAEFRPIATNITSEGRAQNRRVEILISRNYPVKK